jgi:hypothetical protein
LSAISTRYNDGGIQWFAFVFADDSPILSMANESAEGG